MPVQQQRKRRLGVPAVNQNPRPPNDDGPKGPQRQQQKPGQGTNHPGQNNGGGGGQNNNGGGGGGGQQNNDGGRKHGNTHATPMKNVLRKLTKLGTQTNVGPPQQAVAGATTPLNAQTTQQQISALGNNPANALAFSSFQPKPGEADPRDAQYWSNVSNLLYNTQRQQAEGLLGQQRATLDYERGMADMDVARGREQRALAEQAMRSGLANSGWLDRTDAEDTYDFLRNREDYQTSYERDRADRAADMSAGIQDYLAGERDQAIGALDRYQEGQLTRAEDEGPLYAPDDIRRLNRILRRPKRKQGKKDGKR